MKECTKKECTHERVRSQKRVLTKEKDHKFICILIRKLQLYQLLCHNARSRSGKIKNVPTKPSGVVLSSKVGKGRAMFGRKLAPAASSMNKISRYFFKSGSNNTNQAAEN